MKIPITKNLWHKKKKLAIALLVLISGVIGINYYHGHEVLAPSLDTPESRGIISDTAAWAEKVSQLSAEQAVRASQAAAKAVPAAVPAVKTSVGAAASHAKQFGFSAGDLPSLSAAELEARLADFNAMGVSWIRFDIPWDDVQAGGPNSYEWSGYDRVVAAANKHKISSLMIIDYTPAWARRSDCSYTYKCAPNDNAQFAKYAGEVVARYAPLGVKNWEIWNEPNMVGGWEPAPDPVAYTDLLIKSYASIKKADPQAFVLAGGMGVTYTENGNYVPQDFIQAIYNHGGKNYFDGVAQHPYSFPGLATLNEPWSGWYQMLAVRSVMVAQGEATKPIWLTEYGAPTNGSGALATQQDFNFENNPDHVDEALQDQIATISIALYKSYSWAGPMFWYGYKDLGTSTSTNENFFGLVRHDGSHKAAYNAFVSAIR